MAADTLGTLIARAENEPTIRRFGPREAKLAQTIASGVTKLLPDDGDQLNVGNVMNRAPLPADGKPLLIYSTGSNKVLAGIEAGSPGQLLMVQNVGPQSIILDSSLGTPESEDGLYGVGQEISVDFTAKTVSINTFVDEARLGPAGIIWLQWSTFYEGWVAVTPILGTGTITP